RLSPERSNSPMVGLPVREIPATMVPGTPVPMMMRRRPRPKHRSAVAGAAVNPDPSRLSAAPAAAPLKQASKEFPVPCWGVLEGLAPGRGFGYHGRNPAFLYP